MCVSAVRAAVRNGAGQPHSSLLAWRRFQQKETKAHSIGTWSKPITARKRHAAVFLQHLFFSSYLKCRVKQCPKLPDTWQSSYNHFLLVLSFPQWVDALRFASYQAAVLLLPHALILPAFLAISWVYIQIEDLDTDDSFRPLLCSPEKG